MSYWIHCDGCGEAVQPPAPEMLKVMDVGRDITFHFHQTAKCLAKARKVHELSAKAHDESNGVAEGV